MKLLINIAFKYNEDKIPYLLESIDTLERIEADKKIIVQTDATDLKSLVKGIEVESFQLDDPWRLTWQHKKHFPEFMLSDYTHFIYMEDDLKLTPTNFNYWLKARKLFKEEKTNFVPGFLIVEYKDGKAYSCAFHGDYLVNPIYMGNELFFCPENSYQCMFIMDKQLAWEHMNNDSFNPGVWVDGLGQPEAANSAYLHFIVPPGFPNRILMPYNNFSQCWVHHMPDKYANLPNDIHGKVSTDEILEKVRRTILL